MGTRLLIVVGVLALLAACEKRSTKYCGLHEDDLANCEQLDAAVDAPAACTDDDDCSPPHCETTAGVCVECLDDTHCTDGERCDLESYTCRGCIADTDCVDSQTCLPGGACGTNDTVIYVDAAGTDNDECTFTAKCLTIAHALGLVTETRNYIKLSGELTESPIIGVDVEIVVAAGTKLIGEVGPDWVIKVQQSIVKVYDLEIDCAGGSDQTGVKIEMASTVTLTGVNIHGCGRGGGVEIKDSFGIITRSNLHDNLVTAIKSDAKANFSITNNFIHHNGGGVGVLLEPDALRPELKFEFNTLVDNAAATTTQMGIGIQCSRAVPIPNNLIVRNGGLLGANVSGCDASGSLESIDGAGIDFVNAAAFDYHIMATSTAKDTAPVASTVMEDYDGHFRPIDGGKDYGADEYRAP